MSRRVNGGMVDGGYLGFFVAFLCQVEGSCGIIVGLSVSRNVLNDLGRDGKVD